MRNFVGFDTLPLVEFIPTNGLSHKRVMECLRMDPPEDNGFNHGILPKKKKFGDGWQENRGGDEQTLTFNHNEDDLESDLFT